MLTQERLRECLEYDPETGVFRWKIGRRAGAVVTSKNVQGYIRIKIDKVTYRAGRLAWLYVYGRMPEEIDHINRVRDDDRISNLREATSSLNNFNRDIPSNNKSGMKGVCWDARAKSYTVYYGRKHLGRFKLKALAEYARLAAEVAYGKVRSAD